MKNITKFTERMDILIEESTNRIIITQNWKYIWQTSTNATAWNFIEKNNFHSRVNDIIKNTWGMNYFLSVKGSSDFAKRNISKIWEVKFNIKQTNFLEHWKVRVKKYPANHIGHIVSSVKWDSRTIKIDSKDLHYKRNVLGNKAYYQQGIVHEFGHAIGNTNKLSHINHGDEYLETSRYFKDKQSVMNIGQEFRNRHLDFIISELNTMIPNTKFKIS